MARRNMKNIMLIGLLAALLCCAAAAAGTAPVVVPTSGVTLDATNSFVVNDEKAAPSDALTTAPSPATLATASPAPTPKPLPTPQPHHYKNRELFTLQERLAYAGYYGTLSAQEAATGNMDAPTKAAIRGYLTVLNPGRRFTRDYLTSDEYKALIAMGEALPRPTPQTGSTVMTPQPTAIMLTSEADLQAPDSPINPGPQATMVADAWQAPYAPDFTPPTPTQKPVETPMPTPMPTPVPTPTPVPLEVREAWFGRRRADELHIRATVNWPGQAVTLLDTSGRPLATTNADEAGLVTFHLLKQEHGDAVRAGGFTLLIMEPVAQRQPLTVGQVEQDALLGFTKTLDNQALLVTGGALCLIGIALLIASLRSRGQLDSPTAHNKNGTKGRMSP